jgi:hypothetical protein
MTVSLPEFIEGRIIRLSAERIYFSKTIERFKIIDHDRSIIVERNLPELKTRKRRDESVTWKIVSGEIKNQQVYKKVLKSRSGGFDEFPSIDEI